MADVLQDQDWKLILRRIEDEECVPFLGAGASFGGGGDASLPTAAQLSKALANACNYPGSDPEDLFRVAQYFQMVNDAHELRKFIRGELLKDGAAPAPVHTNLAALPFRHILTTNFDCLMEEALRDAGKSPYMAFFDRKARQEQELPVTTRKKPLVYKFHGSIDSNSLDALVVTEDDVIDFLSCLMLHAPPLPIVIKSLFKLQSILFIGYGLRDWNIRAIIRALRGQRATKYFAIQKRPKESSYAKEWDASVIYWEKTEDLLCYNVDAAAFTTELRKRFEQGGRG